MAGAAALRSLWVYPERGSVIARARSRAEWRQSIFSCGSIISDRYGVHMPLVEIALSGAGTLGPLEVGALAALAALGYQPSFLVGTSAGAISAGLTALGKTPAQLLDIVLAADFQRLIDYAPLGTYWRMGYASNQNVRAWLSEITEGQSLGDCVVPFTAVTADTWEMKPAYWRTTEHPDMLMADAIYSSMAIPGVFPPAQMRYVDGGTMSNLAVGQLPGVHPGVALQVTETSPVGAWNGWLQFAERVVSMLISGNEDEAELLAAAKGVKRIRLPGGNVNFLDRSMSYSERMALYQTGRQAVLTAYKEAA